MKHLGVTSTKTAYKCEIFFIAIVLTVISLPGIWFSLCLAQVPPITSSGLNTQVSGPTILPNGRTNYDITGGTRPGGGPNLFHSFGNFNVPTNNIANFLNDSGLATSNILGRVTNGNPSNIFGTIQTTGFGNANLFLMNPAGIVFGPNATLNVGGSVTFTTANYLRLTDNVLFNAIPNAASDTLLSAAPVAAFGFLGSNAEAITVQGSQLSVASGQSISLVGGNITIQSGVLDDGVTIQPARLSAPNGQINLASASSPGEFIFQSLQTGGFQQFPTPFGPVTQFVPSSLTGPNVNGASFTSFGTVHLSPGSTVDTSHNGNSKVSIVGGQFVVDIQNALLTTANTAPPAALGQDNLVLQTGSTITTATSTTDRGPNVQIVTDNIQVLGSVSQPPTPSIQAIIQTTTNGSGAAGNISLTANQGLESFFGQVISATNPQPGPPPPPGSAPPLPTGQAGNINLTSTQGNISLTGQTFVTSTGNAGVITLNAPHGDILVDSSIVNTQITGTGALGANSGGIQVTANNLTMRNTLKIVPGPTIEGDNFVNPAVPGNISVTLAGNLSMDSGSVMQTVSRGPAAAAADLNIRAHDVMITGTNVANNQVFNTQLNTQTISSGKGGQLNIVADSLELTSGGQLKSGSIIGRNPFNGQPTVPTGPGGTINIQGPTGPTTSVLIDGAGSGIFTNSQGSGTGGNTNITAQSLTIQNGGVISAQANGSGPGGQVNISTDNLELATGGQLTSGSVIGINGVTRQPLLPPSGTGGEITIQGLTGPSGSVLIDGGSSGIFSNAVGTGAAGNTNISAQSLTIQNGGTITASTSGTASSASGGTITVKADTVTLNTGGTMTAASTGPGASGEVIVQGPASPAQSILIDGLGSGIFTDTHSTGAGGDIHLSSNSVTLQNGGTLSATTSGTSPSAIGGSISVNATDGVTMTNGGLITASSTGPGNAGNIFINAGQQLQMNGSSITTEAAQASGGNINIQAVDQVRLVNSTISTSVLGGTGSGGNITIDPNSVILQNSQVIAKAIQGAGGNITIVTPLFLADQTSIVDASSEFGLSGTVNIQNPTSNLAGSIASLPSSLRQVQSLQTGRCAALHREGSSSFIVAGRETIPTEPGGWEVSPMASLNIGSGLAVLDERQETAVSSRVPEDQEIVSLRRLTPAGFLTQHFAEDPTSGCRS